MLLAIEELKFYMQFMNCQSSEFNCNVSSLLGILHKHEP